MSGIETTRLTLNQILAERDVAFPRRDPDNTKAVRQALAEYALALRNLMEPAWHPAATYTAQVAQITEKPSFVCGHMKGGTTLLTQLLDGHPELIVLPGDSHMIHWMDDHHNLPYRERLRDWDMLWVRRLVNPTGQRPFWIMGDQDEPYLEFLHYLKYWLDALPELERSPFVAVVNAFYCANPRRPTHPSMWVEKTPGNELHVERILNLFPSARFIHTVRDPRPHLASVKRLSKVRGWNWSALKTVANMVESVQVGLANTKSLGVDRYYLLRFEQLVSKPEVTMRNVAEFLGVPFDDAMLTPTVNGLPAKANSMYRNGQVIGQVNARVGQGWRRELNPVERCIAEIAFLHITRRLNKYCAST